MKGRGGASSTCQAPYSGEELNELGTEESAMLKDEIINLSSVCHLGNAVRFEK